MASVTIEELLSRGRAERVFSGAAYEIGGRSGPTLGGTVGTLSWEDPAPVSPETWWDLASVTKPVVSGLVSMVLLEAGEIALDDPVARFLPGYEQSAKAGITLLQLLTHSSGIPGQQPLYLTVHSAAEMYTAVRHLPLVFAPGSNVVYGSQGFTLLGQILEGVTGEPLDRAFNRLVAEPLGLTETTYRPPAEVRTRTAATERCQWRHRLIRGTVHDKNTEVMGGVSGHAGLFSTVGEVGTLCRMLLCGGGVGTRQLLAEPTVAAMTRSWTDHLPLRWALGWQARNLAGCPGGDLVSMSSYGHTGFTGTSVWMDPELDLYVVLLTNAVHPDRAPAPGRLRAFRPRFHNVVVTEVVGDNRKAAHG